MTFWDEPKFPGDFCRKLDLKSHDGTLKGFVCIQQFNDTVRVASYLPGKRSSMGAFDIMQPELSKWVKSVHEANELFDTYAGYAYAQFWQNLY